MTESNLYQVTIKVVVHATCMAEPPGEVAQRTKTPTTFFVTVGAMAIHKHPNS
jgi:hypothetical protein